MRAYTLKALNTPNPMLRAQGKSASSVRVVTAGGTGASPQVTVAVPSYPGPQRPDGGGGGGVPSSSSVPPVPHHPPHLQQGGPPAHLHPQQPQQHHHAHQQPPPQQSARSARRPPGGAGSGGSGSAGARRGPGYEPTHPLRGHRGASPQRYADEAPPLRGPPMPALQPPPIVFLEPPMPAYEPRAHRHHARHEHGRYEAPPPAGGGPPQPHYPPELLGGPGGPHQFMPMHGYEVLPDPYAHHMGYGPPPQDPYSFQGPRRPDDY